MSKFLTYDERLEIQKGLKEQYRIFDVDDLIINTLGAVVGYLIFPFSIHMWRIQKAEIAQCLVFVL